MSAKEGPPPLFRNVDRGWAWMIAFAGFFIHVVVGGHRRSMGLFFNEIVEQYDTSKSKAAVVISVFYVLSLCSAPFATSLTKRLPVRVVVATGGILICTAFVLTAFVKYLEVTVFTVGAISGIGNAFLHTPTMILIGQYFHKHRTLAVGINLAGGAMGSFIFPPLVSLSVEFYGFPGMMLTVAGLSLQTVIFAMLLRTPEKITVDEIIDAKETYPDVDSIDKHGLVPLGNDSDDEIAPLKLSMEVLNEPDLKDNKEEDSVEPDKIVESKSHEDSVEDKNGLHDEFRFKSSPSIATRLRVLFKSEVIRMPSFYLYALSCAMATEMLPLAFYLIPPLCEDIGVGIERQSLILLIMGIPDLIARLGIGFIADRVPSWRVDMFICFVILKALLWLFVTVWTDYVSIMVFAQLSGLIGGCIFTLYLPMLIDAVGVKNISSIFSFSLVLEGIICLVLPFLLAYVKDVTNSWIASYRIMMGVALLAASLVIYDCKLCRTLCRRKNG